MYPHGHRYRGCHLAVFCCMNVGALTEVRRAISGTQNPAEKRQLAKNRAGFTASTAVFVRSGTGGKGSATPRRWMAKIASMTRTAVGCNVSALGTY